MHEPFPALQGRCRSRGVLPLEGTELVIEREGRRLIDIPEIAFSGPALTVVLGPNGAGKSLLLKTLCGLIEPDGGRVAWGGAAPDRERALRVGMVFQNPVLLRRSVIANISYALGVAGCPVRERKQKALAALDQAGLSHLAHMPARLLSGGEQQRLQLARAMSVAPDLLFLDEPTASADPASTAAIEDLVSEASRQRTKIVLVTHDLAQARRLAEEVVFMHHGQIVERSPASVFFSSPESEEAQAYLAGQIVI